MNTNDEQDALELGDALARLRGATVVPPIDPVREQALLGAFDTRIVLRPRVTGRFVWAMATALLIAAAGGLNWLVAIQRPPDVSAPAEAADNLAGFIALPGASAWPPFESGTVVRIDLPASALPAFGLTSASPSNVVQADIVVAQDGFPRAIRLVEQQ